MRKHMTLIVLALMVVATAGVVAYDSVDEVITFPDSNLESAVRQAIYLQLGKETNGPIKKTDIEKIEHLGISSNTDLTGLEHLTGLKALMISGTEVRNFSSLSNLTNLEGLILHSNEVTDLAPLSALPNLEFLAVVQCQASDLSPLASIKSLRELDLGGNQISDISPLTGLTNLTSLRLSENQITDISPLVENIGLAEGDEVYIRNNPLSAKSINEYIPQLEAMGIKVFWQEKNEE